MLDMLNVFCPMGPMLFLQGWGPELVLYVEFFLQKESFLFSCRKQPEFLHVESFLLKGGNFSQNMLLSAEMLNMLNHVLCYKKRFLLLKC